MSGTVVPWQSGGPPAVAIAAARQDARIARPADRRRRSGPGRLAAGGRSPPRRPSEAVIGNIERYAAACGADGWTSSAGRHPATRERHRAHGQRSTTNPRGSRRQRPWRPRQLHHHAHYGIADIQRREDHGHDGTGTPHEVDDFLRHALKVRGEVFRVVEEIRLLKPPMIEPPLDQPQDGGRDGLA